MLAEPPSIKFIYEAKHRSMMEQEEGSTLSLDLNAPKRYSVFIKEMKSYNREQLEEFFELPGWLESLQPSNDFNKFDQKLVQTRMFKLSDEKECNFICQEFHYRDRKDVDELIGLLNQIKKQPELLDFKQVVIFIEDSKFWLLSADPGYEFFSKRLNRESKNVPSPQTIIRSYRDITFGMNSLAQIANENISVLKDVLLPFASTSGVLYHPAENSFVIGLGFPLPYTAEGINNFKDPEIKAGQVDEGTKQKALIYSLGMMLLEITVGWYTRPDHSRKVITMPGSPNSDKEYDFFKDFAKLMNESRKDHLFDINVDQINYIYTELAPKIWEMTRPTGQGRAPWDMIITEKWFGQRMWSYRVHPRDAKDCVFEPDCPYNLRTKISNNESLVKDGINSTFFVEYYRKKGEALTVKMTLICYS